MPARTSAVGVNRRALTRHRWTWLHLNIEGDRLSPARQQKGMQELLRQELSKDAA